MEGRGGKGGRKERKGYEEDKGIGWEGREERRGEKKIGRK